MLDSKSLITNILSALLFIAGMYSPLYSETLKAIGMFALSGALTNWIAVHMLFEKIPLLYGSGIIPKKFKEFKDSIENMIASEFLQASRLKKDLDLSLVVDNIRKQVDPNTLVDDLIEAVYNSSIKNMLNMFGGKDFLTSFKPKMLDSLKLYLDEKLDADTLVTNQDIEVICKMLRQSVNNRLNELTPSQVKTLVQEIISDHLGWLVIWGGFFGGIIGAIFANT